MDSDLAKPALSAERRTVTTVPFERNLYRLTVAQYHRMTRIGILTKDNRVELLRGYLVAKMPQSPAHARTVRRLDRKFVQMIPEDYVIGIQTPITLKDSEPEPDVSVAEGPETRFAQRHPGPRDTLMVVEVGDSSLLNDRRKKSTLYAQAKIPVYWIVNLVDSVIELYTAPRAGRHAAYEERKDYGPGDLIPLRFGGRDFGHIPVKDLLP